VNWVSGKKMAEAPSNKELEDPADLFFGLNDLATRVRTLKQDELAEWANISAHIDGYLDHLSRLTAGTIPLKKPLTGGMDQKILIAIHALQAARRAAKKRETDPTADALYRASRAIGGGSEMSRPSATASY
jgi:hypothetical protein